MFWKFKPLIWYNMGNRHKLKIAIAEDAIFVPYLVLVGQDVVLVMVTGNNCGRASPIFT